MTPSERLARMVAAKESRPLTTFVPSPAFEAMADRSHRLILARAANRVGKSRHASWVAAKEAIALPEVLGRPARIRIVGPSTEQVNQVIGRYLAEFLVGHLSPLSYYNGRKWNQRVIVLSNGSIIQLRSMKDEVTAHAGDELDLVVIDEPPPRDIFAESLSRIGSVDGRMIVVLTPVGRPVGWLREIVEEEGGPWTQLVAAFSRENCPWYTQEQVDNHLESLSSSKFEYAQRVEGAWEGVSEDRALDGFTDDCVTTEDPEGVVDLALSLDHGVLAGKTVCLLWAFRKGRKAWVVDEWIAEQAHTPEQVAQHVDRMLARHGFTLSDVLWARGDVNVSGHTGAKINDELERAFAAIARRTRAPFRVRPAQKGRGSVDLGIKLLNYAFIRKEIVIHERCTATIDACKSWKGGKTGDDGLLSDRIDALRYGAVAIHGGRKIYAQLRF